MTDQENMKAAVPDAARRYMRYLLIMAGLGGLLYGVDVGVIAAALPYIEQTAGFNPSQLSQVVAAVLFAAFFLPCLRAIWPTRWDARR